MEEDWEKFWKEETIPKKIVGFFRRNYFSGVIISHLNDVRGKSVLEAGCGRCESLAKIARKANRVTGIDLSRNALSLAKNNFKKLKIPTEKYSLVLGDINNMKFKEGAFDITFNAGVIEHFPDNKPIEEMIRVTKKPGKILILVPSKYSFYYLIYIVTRLPFFRKLYPWEEHKFYTFKSMNDQLRELHVKHKVKLSFKSFFLYLIAEIEK